MKMLQWDFAISNVKDMSNIEGRQNGFQFSLLKIWAWITASQEPQITCEIMVKEGGTNSFHPKSCKVFYSIAWSPFILSLVPKAIFHFPSKSSLKVSRFSGTDLEDYAEGKESIPPVLFGEGTWLDISTFSEHRPSLLLLTKYRLLKSVGTILQ